MSESEGRGVKFPNDVGVALAASGLVDGIRDTLALQPRCVQLEEGEFLCRKGEPADRLWIVLAGDVGVRDGAHTIARRARGSVLGEQALLLEGGRRSADLVAMGGTVDLVSISKEAIEGHPEASRIWRNCAAILSLKLAEATVQRARMCVEARDARELLRIHVGEHALTDRRLFPETFLDQYRRLRAVVWFSDIVGFSRFVAQMPPQRAASLVNSFMTPQVEAVTRRDGYVDKLMGDGLMAYWIVDADAARACERALDAAFDALSEVQRVVIGSEQLAVRIGLHVGEVAAGNFGSATRRQYTLIGAEVNKAARLEQARTEPPNPELGWIRVSEEFFGFLPASCRDRLPVTATAKAKNVSDLVVHTNRNGEGG